MHKRSTQTAPTSTPLTPSKPPSNLRQSALNESLSPSQPFLQTPPPTKITPSTPKTRAHHLVNSSYIPSGEKPPPLPHASHQRSNSAAKAARRITIEHDMNALKGALNFSVSSALRRPLGLWTAFTETFPIDSHFQGRTESQRLRLTCRQTSRPSTQDLDDTPPTSLLSLPSLRPMKPQRPYDLLLSYTNLLPSRLFHISSVSRLSFRDL